MIGSIIGDIAGSRFEFNNYLNTDFDLFAPESFFTDDTVCTIAIGKWMVEANYRGITDLSHVRNILWKLCKKYPGLSYGARFREWINKPVPYNSFGNGAAMRIAPVGLSAYSESVVFKSAEMATVISHDHPEGIKGATAVALAIYMARTGKTKSEIRARIKKSFGYNLNFTCDEIRGHYKFDETCQGTVPQSIVAFLESTDFESAIRLAVSIGGDSDTLACITGGIAEAFYKKIPSVMIENVRLKLGSELWNEVTLFYELVNRRFPAETVKVTQLKQ